VPFRRRAAVVTLGLGLSAGCTDDAPGGRPDGVVADAAGAEAGTRFGPGFVDLTAVLDRAPPFELFPPVSGEPESTLGTFGDLDGDGRVEVILAPRVSDRVTPRVRPEAVYTYDPQRRRLVSGPPHEVDPHWRTIFIGDLDGDGVNDLLGWDPRLGVSWGLGGGRFAPATRLSDPQPFDFEATDGGSFYLEDIDQDGWLDVLVGSPGCCMPGCKNLHPFLRTGPRAFAPRDDLLDPAPLAAARTAMVVTMDPGERLLLQIGGSCDEATPAPVFYRESGRDAEGYPRFGGFDVLPLDASYHSGTVSPHVSISSRAPMGAAVGDLDGDGLLDLVVAINPQVAIFAGTPAWPMRDQTEESGIWYLPADSGMGMIPWGAAMIDVDLDGRLDVVVANGNDAGAFYDPSHLVGPQRVSLLWNAGGFRFTDLAEPAHLGRRGQWRSLFVGDLDADGDADLAVGGVGDPPRLYRNDVANGNRGFALRLRGTTSNAFGMGSRVDVTVREGTPPRRFLMGGASSPYAVPEPTVFVGLGAAGAASRVRVTWPSGVVQEVRDVTAGRVHEMTEPPLLAINPPSRHAPADGRTVVSVRVTPRNPDGTIRPGARVAVGLASGGGTLVSPAAPDATGAWVARLTAPTVAGSSVIMVTVDGAAVPLRPRVWWDPP
jgi:hypothetical protein